MAMKTIAIVMKPNMEPYTVMATTMDTGTSILTVSAEGWPSKPTTCVVCEVTFPSWDGLVKGHLASSESV